MTTEARIDVASPTIIVGLDRCGLAVWLSTRARTVGAHAGPSTPSARLGNAAHRVLAWAAEHAHQLAGADDLNTMVRNRWHDECDREQAAATHYPVECGNGPYHEWPRYTTIQANLVVGVAELVDELSDIPPERKLAEISARTAEGDIAGTIDLVILDETGEATVVDHKVGAIRDVDVAPGGRFHTQVLLYAAMVRDSGYRPASAQVRPLGGTPVVLRADDVDLEHALRSARQAVARYNAAVEAEEPLQLASPSEEACRWCPFLIDCPAVWGSEKVDLGDISVIEGVLGSPVQFQRQGRFAAFALTTADGEVTITGLSAARNPVIAGLQCGDRVRVVGVHRNTGSSSYRPAGGRVAVARR